MLILNFYQNVLAEDYRNILCIYYIWMPRGNGIRYLKELHFLCQYQSSPLVLRGIRVVRSLVFCVLFCSRRSLFVLLSFFFWSLYYMDPSLIYDFWLPLWYLRFMTSDYPFGIFKLLLSSEKILDFKDLFFFNSLRCTCVQREQGIILWSLPQALVYPDFSPRNENFEFTGPNQILEYIFTYIVVLDKTWKINLSEQKTEKFTSQNKDFCWSWAGGPVLVVRAEIYVYM